MDHQCRSRDLIIFGECVFLYVYHVSFLCVPCLIPTWAMTLSYVCHDSFLCVTWIICMCTLTHIYVHHDSWTICVVQETWSTSKWAFVCRDSYLCVCPIIQWLTFMYTMTRIFEYEVFFYVCHDSHLSVECVMDQSFKHVISQQLNMSIWKRKRNSSSAHVLTHTHTHIHIRIRTRTHTYTCTFIPPTTNQIKIEPRKRVKLLWILVPQEFSILLRRQNNSLF